MLMKDKEFEDFLEGVRDRQEAFLAATGALEGEVREDDVAVVPGIYEVLGVIYRYFGDTKKSGKFFKSAAKSYYSSEDRFPDPRDSKDPDRRLTIAYQQAFGAISSSLGGDKKRAKKLFKWAAENLRPEEDASSGPTSPTGKEESLALGGFFVLRSYCLLRAGMYKNALEILREAKKIFSNKVMAAAADLSERHLPDALIPLCEYKLKPDEEKRQAAKKAIEDYKKVLKENREKRKAYLYIFDIQDAFPEVYQ